MSSDEEIDIVYNRMHLLEAEEINDTDPFRDDPPAAEEVSGVDITPAQNILDNFSHIRTKSSR